VHAPLVTILEIACATAAAAQAPATRPSPELGVGVTGVKLFPVLDNDAQTDRDIDVRVTTPLTRRFAVEGFVTVGRYRNQWREREERGFYGVQIKQRLAGAGGDRLHAFVTYGAAGQYSRVHLFGRTEHHGTPPWLPLAGGGFQQMLGGSRAAFRIEGQAVLFAVVPFGVRVSAGLSIPLAH
jgi:hypothetical protein